MSDAPKRTVNSSGSSSNTSKPRKSKSEVIRATLGQYLRQRNYTPTEKYRKSELQLTQTVRQAELNMMLDDDVSKVNSFLYSNVMCLNNNPGIVDQQFARFLDFVRTQSADIKHELQSFICPLICHLFVELLKGKDPQPAHNFLRKFAHLVGPVQSPPPHQPYPPPLQQPHTNGNGTPSKLINGNNATAAATPLGGHTFRPITYLPEPENAGTVQKHFMALVEALSVCHRPEDVDNAEVSRLFRYAQQEMAVHGDTVLALKRHLVASGHVMIMHTLQMWFALDIADAAVGPDGEWLDVDAPELAASGGGDGGQSGVTTPAATADGLTTATGPTEPIAPKTAEHPTNAQIESEVKTDDHIEQTVLQKHPNDESIDPLPLHQKRLRSNPSKHRTAAAAASANIKAKAASDQMALEHLRWSVLQVRAYERPMRVLSVNNAAGQLAAADIDPMGCHLAGGFSDSTVRVWPFSQSIYRGRKPYGSFVRRSCAWSLEHDACALRSPSVADDEDALSMSSSDEDDVGYSASADNRRRRQRQTRRAPVPAEDVDDSTDAHTFDCGEHILRGHSAGVTGVLFSLLQPRLLFSVAKDRMMRAWLSHGQAGDYGRPVAVYRGHNYAVWCLAESTVGTYLATGSKDLTARLWNSEREFPLQTYVGHTQDVDSIAFHPNGNYLATGSADQTVRLWCVTSGKLFRVFHESRLPVQTIAFSPDGRLLAAGGEETKIRIFDLGAGSQLAELRDHTAAVTSIVWSTDGQRLVSGCADGTVRTFAVGQLTGSSTATSTAFQQQSKPASTVGAALPRTSPPNSNAGAPAATPPTSTATMASGASSSLKATGMITSGCSRCVRTYIDAGSGVVTCVGGVR